MFEMNPHATGCPWEPLSQYGLPNINWCEATTCSWISEPANTWSNLGYLISAVVMFGIIRANKVTHPVIRTFPWAALAVGLASGIYHASVTWALQILDFAGMYFFLFLPLSYHSVRNGSIQVKHFTFTYITAVTVTSLITGALSRTAFPIQSIVAIFIILIITVEARSYFQAKAQQTAYSIRWFLISYLFIGAGFIASALDVSRTWCEPEAHGWFSQGHAIWHWLTSIGLIFSLPHFMEIESSE